LIATGLLVLAALVLATIRVVPEPSFWLQLLRAAAEAALVGGLADWFAVTALFRRPLGLPIPHTAIIPRNKDRIGEGLGSFVAENFLRPDLVAERLAKLDAAAGVGRWMANPHNAEKTAGWLVSLLPHVLQSFEDHEVRRFLQRVLEEQSTTFDLQPAVTQLLHLFVAGEPFSRALAESLILIRGYLLAEQDRIYRAVMDRSAWWVPRTVDRRIAEAIIRGVAELLDELMEPSHPTRLKFDAALISLIDRLAQSQDFGQMVAGVRDQLMRHEPVRSYLQSIWDGLNRSLLHDLARPDSTFRRAVSGALVSFGGALEAEPEMRRGVNDWIQDVAARAVGPWRMEIGAFIADIVHRWDATTVVERLELTVGRDLQYIRINGTIVGAMVGCMLFLAGRLLP
jgi:uncharacterized membrane-anchored protein YjiN (DUF445 family)